ncbi:hypothetical protein C5167_037082 [Papaver somniferum]|uniref:Uncharacterized protein n=1 Tax=Papaver somniferum TaxID=3469 RepID=A0A4Y7I9Q1_PAPSO|nr:hypothetical protein C5167_037082 [Papaver somniferum]
MNLTLAVSLQLPLLPQVMEKWIYLGPSRMLWISSTSMNTTSEAGIPFDSAPGSTFATLLSASIVLSQVQLIVLKLQIVSTSHFSGDK